jgi:hypothetical protein
MGKASLTDFAATHPLKSPGMRAWLETIPEFPEVLAGWQSGIGQAQIRRWLIDECGYDPTVATRNRLSHLAKQYPRADRG